MELLKEWISSIIVFVLLATVIDLLLPSSKFQKYVKLVVGLLLISIILSPILKLLAGDFEAAIQSFNENQGITENLTVENQIETQKKEIQVSQHAYILEQTAVQLKLEAEEEMMERYGMVISEIRLETEEASDSLSYEDIHSIQVELVPEKEEADESVPVVKQIQIDTAEPLPSAQDSIDMEAVSALLSEKWKVPVSNIDIVIKGGTDSRDE